MVEFFHDSRMQKELVKGKTTVSMLLIIWMYLLCVSSA